MSRIGNRTDRVRALSPFVASFIAACLVLAGFAVFAKTPSKPASKKPVVKPVVPVRKAPVKKAAVKKAPVRRAAAKSTPAKKAPVVRRTANGNVVNRVATVEPAALWHGCVDSSEIPSLASRIHVPEEHLQSVLHERAMLPEGSCLPFVGLTGGEGGAATVVLKSSAPANEAVLVVSRTNSGIATIGHSSAPPKAEHRTLTFAAHELFLQQDTLPESIYWQLKILVPRLLQGADSSATVRASIGPDRQTGRDRLLSVEVTDPWSGKLVDGVWWVQRENGPGVFAGLQGVAHERALWMNPIDFLRQSRGAGPTVSRVVRRNFGAKKGAPKYRTVLVRGYHAGVDLSAPLGTPIHSVADGAISFAGRRGGYGNLVIVDHGLGYQTYYAHLSEFEPGMTEGARVTRGDVIGRVGSTGYSTAPHLHFETRRDSKILLPYVEQQPLDVWKLSPSDHEKVGIQVLSNLPPSAPAVAGVVD
jgi:murein DD-endopeptidase MepM/ murein hydrolase activator NlpD